MAASHTLPVSAVGLALAFAGGCGGSTLPVSDAGETRGETGSSTEASDEATEAGTEEDASEETAETGDGTGETGEDEDTGDTGDMPLEPMWCAIRPASFPAPAFPLVPTAADPCYEAGLDDPDPGAPVELVGAQIVADREVELRFSEPVASVAGVDPRVFRISGGLVEYQYDDGAFSHRLQLTEPGLNAVALRHVCGAPDRLRVVLGVSLMDASDCQLHGCDHFIHSRHPATWTYGNVDLRVHYGLPALAAEDGVSDRSGVGLGFIAPWWVGATEVPGHGFAQASPDAAAMCAEPGVPVDSLERSLLPALASIERIAPTTLRLSFSEAIDPQGILRPEQFALFEEDDSGGYYSTWVFIRSDLSATQVLVASPSSLEVEFDASIPCDAKLAFASATAPIGGELVATASGLAVPSWAPGWVTGDHLYFSWADGTAIGPWRYLAEQLASIACPVQPAPSPSSGDEGVG